MLFAPFSLLNKEYKNQTKVQIKPTVLKYGAVQHWFGKLCHKHPCSFFIFVFFLATCEICSFSEVPLVPQRSVLFADLNGIVASVYGTSNRSFYTLSSGSWVTTQEPIFPNSFLFSELYGPVHCYCNMLILRAMFVILVRLRTSLFRIPTLYTHLNYKNRIFVSYKLYRLLILIQKLKAFYEVEHLRKKMYIKQ